MEPEKKIGDDLYVKITDRGNVNMMQGGDFFLYPRDIISMSPQTVDKLVNYLKQEKIIK
jgi:hypothetical protein